MTGASKRLGIGLAVVSLCMVMATEAFSAHRKAVTSSALPAKCHGESKGTIGFANAYMDGADPTWVSMNNYAKYLANQRCYDILLLNNNIDGPTAVKNANLMVSKKVKYAIEFQVIAAANAVISAKLAKAKIPVITFDVDSKGWHFVGVPNSKAGRMAGTRLGVFAKREWNCKADLVLLVGGATAGPVVKARIDGARDGLLSVCPNLKSVIDLRDGGTSTGPEIQALTRNSLAAHPNARRILTLHAGGTETESINAAEQVGRAGEMYGYGQGGPGVIGRKTVNPHLLGEIAYFLDSYPYYAFKLIDKFDAGETVKNDDTPTSSNATVVQVCAISPAVGKTIPGAKERVKRLIAAKNKTMAQLFCPKGTIG